MELCEYSVEKDNTVRKVRLNLTLSWIKTGGGAKYNSNGCGGYVPHPTWFNYRHADAAVRLPGRPLVVPNAPIASGRPQG